jgi:hypothetical protein
MSAVSRSVYQKLKEENKRLLKDIKLLTYSSYESPDRILCIKKWRDKFRQEEEFNNTIKKLLGVKP